MVQSHEQGGEGRNTDFSLPDIDAAGRSTTKRASAPELGFHKTSPSRDDRVWTQAAAALTAVAAAGTEDSKRFVRFMREVLTQSDEGGNHPAGSAAAAVAMRRRGRSERGAVQPHERSGLKVRLQTQDNRIANLERTLNAEREQRQQEAKRRTAADRRMNSVGDRVGRMQQAIDELKVSTQRGERSAANAAGRRRASPTRSEQQLARQLEELRTASESRIGELEAEVAQRKKEGDRLRAFVRSMEKRLSDLETAKSRAQVAEEEREQLLAAQHRAAGVTPQSLSSRLDGLHQRLEAVETGAEAAREDLAARLKSAFDNTNAQVDLVLQEVANVRTSNSEGLRRASVQMGGNEQRMLSRMEEAVDARIDTVVEELQAHLDEESESTRRRFLHIDSFIREQILPRLDLTSDVQTMALEERLQSDADDGTVEDDKLQPEAAPPLPAKTSR